MEIDVTWKDFEIRPMINLDGDKPKGRYELVRWYDHEPVKVWTITKDEKKEITKTRSCYAILLFQWDEDDSTMDIECVGSRFFADYTEGLSEFVSGFVNFVEPMLERERDS